MAAAPGRGRPAAGHHRGGAVRRTAAARGAGRAADRGDQLDAGASGRRGRGHRAARRLRRDRSAARWCCTAARSDLPWKMLQRSCYSCRFDRRGDADRRRPRRHRRVRRIAAARCMLGRRPVDRTCCTARRSRRSPRRRSPSPTGSASRGRCCASDRRHARPAGWRGRPRNGRVSPIELAQKAADGFAEDPDAI